jgi:hypothetical protein
MARTDDFEDIFAAMVEKVLAVAVADAVKLGVAEGWRQAIAALEKVDSVVLEMPQDHIDQLRDYLVAVTPAKGK